MKSSPAIALVITLGILSVSTAAVFIKLCDDAPAVVIAAARLSIATLILIPPAVLARRRGGAGVSKIHLGRTLLAGAFLAGHFHFWIASLKHTSALSSTLLVTTNPVFVAIASYFLFRERIHRWLAAGIMLAAAGGAVVAVSDASSSAAPLPARTTTVDGTSGVGGETDPLYGDLLAVAGAIMGSCYFLVGRRVRKEMSLLTYITPVYAVAAVLLLIVMVVSGEGFGGYRGSTYLFFLLLAVVPQILGHGSLNWALKYMSATLMSIFLLAEPIGTAILAYLVLGEHIAPTQGIGGGLILVGILLASRGGSTDPRPYG